MLAAYDSGARKLVDCDALPDAGWVHATNPSAPERRALIEAGVPEGFLAHSLDYYEVARVDHDPGGAALVVIRVPDPAHRKKHRPIRAVPLGVVVVNKKLCVTISPCPTRVVDRVLERDDLEHCRPLRLLLLVALAAADEFLREVQAIDEKVDRVEDRLQDSQENREVLELLAYQKSLVHLTTALGSDQIMLERLQSDEKIGFDKEERDVLEDAVVEFRQANEMTKVSEEILGSMMDAFASIISNNLNVVVKALTALTIVLTFPALVSSFYGMNVRLPLGEHPHAFKILLAISLLLSGLVAWVFHRRKWL
jgi:magnesium transporter